MSIGEYEYEPIRGLPEYLPDGETLLWQGAPDWRVMARRVFHVRAVAIYFALLIAVHLVSELSGGEAVTEVLLGLGWQLALGATGLAILLGLARAYASSTVYTVTNKRLVMRFGVALPMMVNLPLDVILAADLKAFPDGSGDIIFTVEKRQRLSYLVLWPNLRSWRFRPVQPALRSLPDAHAVAAHIAQAVGCPAPQAPVHEPAGSALAGAA